MLRLLLLLSAAATMLACATAPAPRLLTIDGGTIYVDDGGRGGVPLGFTQ